MKRLLAVCVLLSALAVGMAYAHSGGTDANGGHYDRSTGEYHYHHGYPAHSHAGGRCPYDYKDKTEYRPSVNAPEENKVGGAGATIAAVAVVASIYVLGGMASGHK